MHEAFKVVGDCWNGIVSEIFENKKENQNLENSHKIKIYDRKQKLQSKNPLKTLS